MIVFEMLDWRRVLRGDPCCYCGVPSQAIDHIEPQKLGGGDTYENLTPACHSCNSSKRTRPLLVYLAERWTPKPATRLDGMLSLVMPAEQVDFLKRLAQRNERTLSAEIRLLVRQAMEQEREAA